MLHDPTTITGIQTIIKQFMLLKGFIEQNEQLDYVSLRQVLYQCVVKIPTLERFMMK
jgi:hypothetical protein